MLTRGHSYCSHRGYSEYSPPLSGTQSTHTGADERVQVPANTDGGRMWQTVTAYFLEKCAAQKVGGSARREYSAYPSESTRSTQVAVLRGGSARREYSAYPARVLGVTKWPCLGVGVLGGSTQRTQREYSEYPSGRA